MEAYNKKTHEGILPEALQFTHCDDKVGAVHILTILTQGAREMTLLRQHEK
jgi:hypothetical protein